MLHSCGVAELPSQCGTTVEWLYGNCGLLDGHGRVIDGLEFWSSRGRRVGWVDVASLNRKFGINAVTIPRSELLELLAARLHPGTVRFGARCEGVHPLRDRAVTKVAGGEDLEADLVVGADGHRSVIRTLFAPAGPSTPTGWASLQGLTAAPLALTDGSISIYATGAEGGIGMMPTGGGLLQWWFDVPWPHDPLPTSVACWLQDRFARWQPPMRDLLDVISDDDIAISPRMARSASTAADEPGRTHWRCSAHHPSVLAQGANQSIEDAWVLCRELKATPSSISVALESYQEIRRPKVVALSQVTRRPMLPLYGLASRLPRCNNPRVGLYTVVGDDDGCVQQHPVLFVDTARQRCGRPQATGTS